MKTNGPLPINAKGTKIDGVEEILKLNKTLPNCYLVELVFFKGIFLFLEQMLQKKDSF
jgi:hypothetical protein